MDSYNINFKPSVEKDLRPLSKTLLARVMERIERLKTDPFPRQAIKLSGTERLYRIRVGDYRIVYEVDTQAKQIMIHLSVIAARYIARCESQPVGKICGYGPSGPAPKIRWRALLKCRGRCAKWRLEPNGGQTMRQVIIYPGEDGYWVAECPSLPGCISQGKTKEEAITNIREAIQGYIAALEEDHLPVPEERFEALVVAV